MIDNLNFKFISLLFDLAFSLPKHIHHHSFPGNSTVGVFTSLIVGDRVPGESFANDEINT